jgi:hypothetical protein
MIGTAIPQDNGAQNAQSLTATLTNRASPANLWLFNLVMRFGFGCAKIRNTKIPSPKSDFPAGPDAPLARSLPVERAPAIT